MVISTLAARPVMLFFSPTDLLNSANISELQYNKFLVDFKETNVCDRKTLYKMANSERSSAILSHYDGKM